MIPIIDNLGYNGPLPNFDRDNLSWEEMMNITDDVMDIGHIVLCTSDDDDLRGHYVYLGVTQEEEEESPSPKWVKIIDKDGKVHGEADISPIPDEFIDELSEDDPFNPTI